MPKLPAPLRQTPSFPFAGRLRELDTLRANNLGLGASLDNVVALDEYRVVNHDGLRYDDEFVRHKILDIVGDFYLLGRPVRGRVVARRTGHGDNAALLRVLRERFGLQPLRPVESTRAS